ncbi:FkbM family methyltransferase [Rhodovibrio sodomensis]|nr:FkbM family methyltransferase [Rhodovibrio sodomensis]
MTKVAGLAKRTYWKLAKKLTKSKRASKRQGTAVLSGTQYQLPTWQESPLNFSEQHERWLDPIFSTIQNFKEGSFLDVGVNRGQTLAKFLTISPERTYIGFEPQASCVTFLQDFFRINKKTNCRVVPAGLSDVNGVKQLFFRTGQPGDGTASIAEAHRPASFYTESWVIPVFKGDDIIPELEVSNISTVKIDVEGAELEVIKGMRDTLGAMRPFLVFEVLNNFLVATGEALSPELTKYRNRRALEISETLNKLGYNIYNIHDRSLIQIREIKPEISSDLTITDYLAIPKEYENEAKRKFSEYFEFRNAEQSQMSA